MSINEVITDILDQSVIDNEIKTNLITGIIYSMLPETLNKWIDTDDQKESYIRINHAIYNKIGINPRESVILLYLKIPYNRGEGYIYWDGIGLYDNPHIETSLKRLLRLN